MSIFKFKMAVRPRFCAQRVRYGTLSLLLYVAIVWSASAALGNDGLGRAITGPDKEHFLQTWRQHLQDMDSLHMIFTQEKHLRVLQRPIVSQGELWLKGKTLLYHLKNSAGAVELAMRIDETAIQTYYPLLQSLEVIERQSVPLSSAPMPLISHDLVALTQAYDSELFELAGHYRLKLTPKPSEVNASFAAIWLRLEAFQMRQLIQVEKNGDRVVMTISVFNPNAAISDAQLALRPAAGTKVVYPLRQ